MEREARLELLVCLWVRRAGQNVCLCRSWHMAAPLRIRCWCLTFSLFLFPILLFYYIVMQTSCIQHSGSADTICASWWHWCRTVMGLNSTAAVCIFVSRPTLKGGLPFPPTVQKHLGLALDLTFHWANFDGVPVIRLLDAMWFTLTPFMRSKSHVQLTYRCVPMNFFREMLDLLGSRDQKDPKAVK